MKPVRGPSKANGRQRRTLADLLTGTDDEFHPAPPTIDDEFVGRFGIRRLDGKHLTLYTDLPPCPDVDELPAVFDLAVPQWCEYFEIPAERAADWRLYGYVMGQKERFLQSGLLPRDLQTFLHGFQRGYELWLYEQPSPYFRRHLLLHEGTHGFMNWMLGGTGPPWYMEGTAELLATHRWQDGKLTLRYFPRDNDEVPQWGRVKIIKDELDAGRAMTIGQVMQYDANAFLEVTPYAWCWGAAAFLDNHPSYQPFFRALRTNVKLAPSEFTGRFIDELKDQWQELDEQWQLFVVNMEYGYDVRRSAVRYQPGRPLPDEGAAVQVAADRGWQSSGLRLEAGKSYQITASGRYQIASDPDVWWCEPGGVTIHYYRHRPMGVLLGKVCPDNRQPGLSPLTQPSTIGLERTITPTRSGTLYLCINESPADLSDNAGSLNVHIVPLRPN